MRMLSEHSSMESDIIPRIITVLFCFIFSGAMVFKAFAMIPILQRYSAKVLVKPLHRNIVSIVLGIAIATLGLLKNLDLTHIQFFISGVFNNALSLIFSSIFMLYLSRKMSVKFFCA